MTSSLVGSGGSMDVALSSFVFSVGEVAIGVEQHTHTIMHVGFIPTTISTNTTPPDPITSPPIVVITTPVPGGIINLSPFLSSGTAQDPQSQTDGIEIFIDGVKWDTLAGGTGIVAWEFNWQTDLLLDGTHQFRIRATNQTGVYDQKISTVVIDLRTFDIPNAGVRVIPDVFNPSLSSTTISFVLSEPAQIATVTVGGLIVFVGRDLPAGVNSFQWGRDTSLTGNQDVIVQATSFAGETDTASPPGNEVTISANAVSLVINSIVTADLDSFVERTLSESSVTVNYTTLSPVANIQRQRRVFNGTNGELITPDTDTALIEEPAGTTTWILATPVGTFTHGVYRVSIAARKPPPMPGPQVVMGGAFAVVASSYVADEFVDPAASVNPVVTILRPDTAPSVSIVKHPPNATNVADASKALVSTPTFVPQSAIYDIAGPANTSVIVLFRYNPELFGGGGAVQTIQLRRWDGFAWNLNDSLGNPIQQFVDETNNMVVAHLTQLSLYALMSQVEGQAPTVSNVSGDPFSPNGDGRKETTFIRYTLSDNSPSVAATVRIFSSTGALVRTLTESDLRLVGAVAEFWDGRDDAGIILSEGIYTLRVQAKDASGNISAEQSGTVAIDLTSPSPITTLAASTGDLTGEVRLKWTAVGDDQSNTNSLYFVKFATHVITEANFNSASVQNISPPPPVPASAGTLQSHVVTGLTPNQEFFFAMNVEDNAGNRSAVSNSPSAIARGVGSPIRFNEIAPSELAGDKIEIFVATSAIYSGYRLYEVANAIGSELVKVFPTTGAWASPLPSNTLIVLNFASTLPDETTIINNVINLYTTDPGLRATDNVLMLSDPSGISFSNGIYQSGAIVDFVTWANQDDVNYVNQQSQMQAAVNAAVSQGEWSKLGSAPIQFDAVNSRGLDGAGKAIARNPSSSDGGLPAKHDWSYRTSLTTGSVNGPSTTIQGDGSASLSPGGPVAAGLTNTNWTLTYTNSSTANDNIGHMVTIDIPSGWSAPQTTSPSGVGFTTTTFQFTQDYEITTSGNKIILPVGNLANGESVAIQYKNATVQPFRETAIFALSSDETGTNVGPLLSGSPSLFVTDDTEAPSVSIFEPREGGAIPEAGVADAVWDGKDRLYSATSSGEILARDVSTHRVLLTGNVSGTPTALFFSTHTQRLFVATKNPNAIISLEPTSLSVLSNVSLDAFVPKQMVSDSSGQKVFVIGENSSEILEVSGSFQTISQRTNLSAVPRVIVSRPATSEVFILSASELSLFSENNLFSKKSFITLPDPTGFSEDTASSRIYVSNKTDLSSPGGSLWVLDSNNLSPIATLVSFDKPTLLAFNPSTRRLIVSNEGTKELFVIQPDLLTLLPKDQKTDITQIIPGKRSSGLTAKLASPTIPSFGKGLALAQDVSHILNESTAQSLPGKTDRFYIASKDKLIFFEESAALITPKSPSKASFFVKDNLDLLPSVSATLKNHTKSITRTVQNNEEINPLNLEDGFWTMIVEATDASGNKTTQESGIFETIRDIMPPRTSVSVGVPNFSAQPTFVSSETVFTLSSVDDLLQVGDIHGLGVKEIRAVLDSGAFVVFPATFTQFTLNPPESLASPGEQILREPSAEPAHDRAGPGRFSKGGIQEGNHTLRFLAEDLAGNIETGQTLSVFLDISAPESNVSLGSPNALALGEQFVSTQTQIGFSSKDKPSGGSGVKEIQFSISNFQFSIFTSPFVLSEGKHIISFFAEDNLQHKETVKVSTISADGTAPTTTLTITGPNYPGEPTLVSGQTQFALFAIDPVSNGVASGIDQIQFRISNFGFLNFTSPFSLSQPDGIKTIDFFSKDKVQNTETTQSQSFELDATAPQVSLTNPSPNNQGVCRVVKGQISVVGTIFDSHIESWKLEASPFQDASFGFSMISSGTTNASKPSLLALWNTSTLSGHVTLRLSAVDLIGNESSTQVSLFVGDPELALSISGGLLNKPSGIAVESDGEFWVSDTNNDKVRKFSPAGALLQTLDIGFNKPKGLALDSSGNLYVCDTNNNRIVKLNINGIFLRDFGRKGSLPGDFNKPTSIALDQKGNMYIADRNNGRIQKLNPQGHFLMDFVAASMSPTFGENEDDVEGFDAAPFGVALDSNENVYASNEKRDEIVIFSPLGMVLKTITGFKKPQGVAIFQDYLYVADRNNERVQKFDTLQLPVLQFGSKEKDKSDPLFMHKPTALATDSSGNLYLTDRNEDTVKVFRFPTGQAPILIVLEKEKEKPKEEAKKPEEEKKEEEKEEEKKPDEVAVAVSSPTVVESTPTVSSQAPEVSTQTASSPAPAPQTAPAQPSSSSDGTLLGNLFGIVETVLGNSSKNPDADSALHLTEEDVKITPENPKPGQNITFHIEPGGADTIELVISDQAGNTIHEQTTAAAPLEGSRHKINLHWDTDKDIPEGQYLYLIRVHKGPDTQKVLKTLLMDGVK